MHPEVIAAWQQGELTLPEAALNAEPGEQAGVLRAEEKAVLDMLRERLGRTLTGQLEKSLAARSKGRGQRSSKGVGQRGKSGKSAARAAATPVG